MKLVKAIFVNNEIEPGWLMLKEDVPLGREYIVDLDDQQAMHLVRREDGRSIDVQCIWAWSPGEPGYLPLCALQLSAS